jgi:glycosyltransferase involved in cell wall biosynthesis
MQSIPHVTAVIPTRNRPLLVTQAVKSALSQSHRNMEVVVVIDGLDLRTKQALQDLNDARLQVITLPKSVGAAQARNVGVSAARGEWIGFLDDDDEWLPQKIELQLALANQSRFRFPIISCRFIAHTPNRDYIWPRRLPALGETVADYLFGRSSIFHGEGFIATPTLLARKELLVQFPLRADLKKHEDWDWMIRVANLEGVGFEFAEQPLAAVSMGANRKGLSNSDDWQFSLNWIRERRDSVSQHAYAAFVLTVVADQAARQATLAEYLALPFESWRNGSPRLFDFLLYAGIGLFPRGARHNLRQLIGDRS